MINIKRDANTVILSLEFKLESILNSENGETFFLILRITSFGKKNPKNSISQTLYVINYHTLRKISFQIYANLLWTITHV